MSSCGYAEKLRRFLDDEVGEGERAEIELHVETCGQCQDELERLTDLDPANWPVPPVPWRGYGGGSEAPSGPPPDAALPSIPGYQVLEKLGRGGNGVVYLVYDPRLKRQVALKRILAGAEASPSDRARFRTDAEALARLRHPNIVQIHEVGEHDGRPFFVMEYAAGGSLEDRLGDQPQPPRAAARLVETLARAVHYAHQRGVIHRDLKPGNVLVALPGGPPEASDKDVTASLIPGLADVCKLTDFGLAKFLDEEGVRTCLTRAGVPFGTPRYMAPEQAAGKVAEISTLTDVHALGAILYKLLTGHAPYEGDNELEIIDKVKSEEERPERPGRWRPGVPGDLELICLKCLEKEPVDRYASAEQLADELRRFLKGEPLLHTRPVSLLERLLRWCRRNPALATAGGLAASLLVATTVLSVGWAVHASRLAATVQEALAENHLDRGLAEAERGDVGLGLHWMARGLETVPSRADALARTIRANLAGWRRPLFALANCRTPPGKVLGFSPDGGSAWTVDPDKKVLRRWELTQDQYAGPPLQHARPVTVLAVSPDGKLVATGCHDGTVRLWNAATGQVERALPGENAVCAVAFSPDGRTLLTGRLEWKDRQPSTAFQAWDAATGQPLAPTFQHADDVRGFAYSPDGHTLVAIPGPGKTVARWEMPSGRFLGAMLPHQGVVQAVAYSPDGRTILTGGEDHAARLWEAATGRLLAVLYHREPVWAVAFGPDGRTLLTASPGDAVRVWQGVASPKPLQVRRHPGAVRALAVSPDGTRVVTGSDDRVARVWEMLPDRLVLVRELQHGSALASATFSQDGKLLATSTHQNNAALLWEVNSGRLIAELPHGRPVRMTAFSPDSTRVATASYDGTAQLWDTDDGRPAFDRALAHDGAVVSVAFSPDGRTLLTGSDDGTARQWDAATGAPLGQPLPHGDRVLAVVFSPDGRILLTGSADGTARRWDAATGTPMKPAFEHGYTVWTVAFSPGGQTILTGSWDHNARLWDAGTGGRRGAPLRHAGPIRSAAFSADGRWIVTASEDATARVWDADTGRALGPPLPHDSQVYVAAVAPDRQWVVTAGADRTVRLWPAPAPLEAGVPRVVLWAQVLTGMELDPGGGVQVLDAEAWRRRRQGLHEWGGSPMP
jgi:eukaryotic-like serine/threonine-protein kinase